MALPVAIIAFIFYMNNKCTKYCGKCGAQHYNRQFWQPMNFCSKCGVPLNAAKNLSTEDLVE